MCGCPRSRSATPGRPTSAPRRCPGWAITRSTTWPPFRGPPTARWRWPRPQAVLGEASEVRDIALRADAAARRRDPGRRRRVGDVAGCRRLRGGDRSRMANTFGGPRRCCTPDRGRSRPATCLRHGRSAGGAPVPRGRRRVADALRRSTVCTMVLLSPVWRAAHAARAATVSTVLAEVALPRSIRSQQSAYGIHPALLDACFQSVAAHPDVQAAGSGGLLLPLGVRRLVPTVRPATPATATSRVTNADAAGVEADLDVLDEHGTVLLAVRGLQLGTGVSEQRQPRSRAQRAAADHRMATARAARGSHRPTRDHGC